MSLGGSFWNAAGSILGAVNKAESALDSVDVLFSSGNSSGSAQADKPSYGGRFVPQVPYYGNAGKESSVQLSLGTDSAAAKSAQITAIPERGPQLFNGRDPIDLDPSPVKDDQFKADLEAARSGRDHDDLLAAMSEDSADLLKLILSGVA